MSSSKTDDKFWDRTDEIINLANKQCDSTSIKNVNSSLLFAASRFNVFIAASLAKDVEQLKNDKNDALKYFIEQYTKMFNENFDEYVKNYDKHTNNTKNN